MIIKKGTTLYHGSYAPVEEIDLKKCEDDKDFGKGFYLTTSLEQAVSFIPSSVRKAFIRKRIPEIRNHGYVSSFTVKEDIGLPTFYFEGTNKEWLYFMSKNRRATLSVVLQPAIPQELEQAEIIVGKIANDTTNPTLTAFLSGLYGPVDDDSSAQTAIKLLLPDRLKDQYCFKTKRSIEYLQFVESKKYDF